MKQWKKQLSAALCAALLLGCVSMPALAEENELVIRCTDDLHDQAFPYGKQVMNRGRDDEGDRLLLRN